MLISYLLVFWTAASAQTFEKGACQWVAPGACTKSVSQGRCGAWKANSLCCCEAPLISKDQNKAFVFLKTEYSPEDHFYLTGPIAEILWNNIPGEKSIAGSKVLGPQTWKKEIKGEYHCRNKQFQSTFRCDFKKIGPATAKMIYSALEPTQGPQPTQKVLGPLKCTASECKYLDSSSAAPKASPPESEISE
jgi:hypothetical protein